MITARDIILAFHDKGFSDGDIAKAIGSSRPTICNIRNQQGDYNGRYIYKKLVALARINNLAVTPRPAARQPARTPAPQRAAQPTHKPAQSSTSYLEIARRYAAQQEAQKQQAPRPAAPLSGPKRRCAQCPFQPPIGLKPADFARWLGAHPCERQQRGKCPA